MRITFLLAIIPCLLWACDKDPGHKQETPPPPATGQYVTSGGGELSSDHYRLKLSVAPVQPVGTVSGNQYKLTLGPVAQEN